jgi:hypothetical protein
MTDAAAKKPEEWSEFQKRVIAAERFHGRGFLPKTKSFSIISLIAGFLLIILYLSALKIQAIYNIGILLVLAGVIILGAISWVNSGSNVIKKEREKMIQERGITRKCKYFSGVLPDGLSPAIGKCSLYEKSLESYPYCIYCTSYITKKQEEEIKLNVKIN